MKSKSGDQKKEKEINKKLEDIRKNNKKKKPVNAFKESEEKYRTIKARYIFESIIILVFCIFVLILLCNRTFFKNKYKTSKIDIDIPLMMYFVKDSGNEVVFKTFRKSAYLKEYFDEKLASLPKYTCEFNSFYYDEKNKLAIYDIDIDKSFAIKTVKIKYVSGDYDCLCNAKIDLLNAEKICS